MRLNEGEIKVTIEEMVKNYKPGDRAKEVVEKSSTIMLVGITGAGKDTVQARILESPDYHKMITYTTRAPRYNDGILEQDGREYHFVTKDEMYELLDTKQMIEVNKYGDQFYGSSIREFDLSNQTGKIVVADVDVHGISAMRDLGGDAVVALFILPPSYKEWISRLKKRYPDERSFNEVLDSRRVIAAEELEFVLSVPYYHFIINDDLDRAVRIVDKIAHRGNVFSSRDDEVRQLAQDLLQQIRL